MFGPSLETVLLRRQMSTQFPLKHSSRDVSSIGDLPAVISDVLRPKVLADGRYWDCKGVCDKYASMVVFTLGHMCLPF